MTLCGANASGMLACARRNRRRALGGHGMEIGTGSGKPIAEPSWPEPRPVSNPAGGPARGGRLQPLRQFFTSGPVACPYVGGRAERKLIVELAGARRRRFLRRAVARRVSPQPGLCLSSGLPAMPGLRAGADRGRPLRAQPLDPPCAQLQQRAHRQADRRPRHPRAIPAVHRLPALAPPRQRHGDDELCRLPQHG